MSLDASDRQEIQDLLIRYCYAVDDRDWDAFRNLFVDDAVLDYSAFGGPAGRIDVVMDFLEKVLAGLAKSQHTISTVLLDADGDRVKARTAAQVMMVTEQGDHGTHVSFSGLWYHDSIVKTAAGWRIAERVQKFGWVHNMPA